MMTEIPGQRIYYPNHYILAIPGLIASDAMGLSPKKLEVGYAGTRWA
ncbi:MAG: hypothetical protein LLG42_03680 [Chloroflexi bacterium]|nr:hypothetical protein [Chloroflexota bacterium]